MDIEPTALAGSSELTEMPGGDDSFETKASTPERPLSIREAAEIALRDSDTDSSDADSNEADVRSRGPEKTEAPAVDDKASGEAPATPTGKTFTSVQGAIDHVVSLISQGRIAELPPEVRGQIQRVQENAVSAAAEKAEQEAYFNSEYVSLLELRNDDPEAYLERIESEEGLADFVREYARQHPDVSLENPRPAPRGKSEADIRTETSNEMGLRLSASLRALADEHGVKNYEELTAQSQTTGAGMMVLVVDAAIKAGVEKQVEKIRAEERAAAEKEALVKLNMRMPSAPVSSGSRDATQGDGKVVTMFDAYRETQRAAR